MKQNGKYEAEQQDVLTPYQQAIRTVLEMIADLEPDAGESISEVCIFTRTAPIDDPKPWRDVVRTAFEVWADRGYARRVHNHWQVTRPFRGADVARLLNWQGKWVSRTSANGFAQR